MATKTKRVSANRAASTVRKRRAGGGQAELQTSPELDRFLLQLTHPLKGELEAIRRIILEASPDIREELKWNAPSFRAEDHFATFNLREKNRLRLILHRGAKAKSRKMEVADPEGLLEWLAEDRALVTFRSLDEVEARRHALQAIVRDWISRAWSAAPETKK